MYNDRILSYRKIKELNNILDAKPSEKDIMKIVNFRIRNLQAFRELRSFNDSGTWLYKHPLIIHMSERVLLEKLKTENPEKFLKEYALCVQNVARYSSFLKNKKRKEKWDKDKENLKKHLNRKMIFEDVLAIKD